MGRTSDAKERLMAATLDLIWEESYGAVTIDDICKRAGVKKGSFYYFFPGKAELAVAALEDMWQNKWKPFLDKHLSPAQEPYARIRGYLEAAVTMHKQLAEQHGKVLGCPLCSLGNEVCGFEQTVIDTIRDLFVRKRRYYESAIRDALASGVIEPCDPAEKATALFALINGLVSQARIMNDVKLLDYIPPLGMEMLKFRAPVPA